MTLTDHLIARANLRQTRSRFFPELDREVHCAPWTAAERSTVIKSARDNNFDAKYEIEVLLLKAIDSTGQKLFTPHDRVRLLHQGDPALIGQIADFLIGPEIYINEAAEVERLGEPSAPPPEPTSTTIST